MIYQEVQRFLEELRSLPPTASHRSRLDLLSLHKSRVAQRPPSIDDLKKAFTQMLSERAWDIGVHLIGAAYLNLSKEYVPFLCEIIDTNCDRAPIENAVELLAEIPSMNAVPSLARSIDYRFDYDAGLQIPQKALYALSKIGGDEAYAIVRACCLSDEDLIRGEAQSIISSPRQS